MTGAPLVAFYTPTRAFEPDNASGETPIARDAQDLLERAGYRVALVSELSTLEKTGDPARQEALQIEADWEIQRLCPSLARRRPALWYTYHCYYRCPDLIGPAVSRALAIPYVIQQPAVSPGKRGQPGALFNAASEAAIAQADLLLWSTERDVPALKVAGHAARMAELPPVIEPGPAPAPRDAGTPVRLLTVAHMPEGSPKIESYRRLADALGHLGIDWRLRIAGGGRAEAAVRAAFAPLGERAAFLGALPGAGVAAELAAADLLVWPGVGEGVCRAYLEAQAAGVPVVAEDHGAQRSVVAGPLVASDAPRAFARAIEEAAAERRSRGIAARAHVERRHAPERVAAILGDALARLLKGPVR